MESFLPKDNFYLLWLPLPHDYRSAGSSWIINRLFIHPHLGCANPSCPGHHWPFALCELHCRLGLLYGFASLTVICDKHGGTVSCLFYHFKRRGTAWFAWSGIWGISQLWRPCLSALATGHCSIFSTNQPLCSLISDSGADITAVYLCLQGLVIYFILSGRMLSSKLLQTL